MRTRGQFNKTFTSVIIGISESRGEFPVFDRLGRESVMHLFGRLSRHLILFKARIEHFYSNCYVVCWYIPCTEFSAVVSNRGRYGVEINTFTKRSL